MPGTQLLVAFEQQVVGIDGRRNLGYELPPVRSGGIDLRQRQIKVHQISDDGVRRGRARRRGGQVGDGRQSVAAYAAAFIGAKQKSAVADYRPPGAYPVDIRLHGRSLTARVQIIARVEQRVLDEVEI